MQLKTLQLIDSFFWLIDGWIEVKIYANSVVILNPKY